MNTFPFLQVANFCEQMSRLWIPLRLELRMWLLLDFPKTPDHSSKWVITTNIQVLNIAGPRETVCPGFMVRQMI
jgi:hypothetical protein